MVKKGSKVRPKKPVAAGDGRVRKLTKKQQKTRAKKLAKKQSPILGSFRLTKQVFLTLRKFWKPLGRVFLVYVLLNAIFSFGLIVNLNRTTHGLSGSNDVSKAFHGFGSLLSNTAPGSSATFSIVQSFLLVLESLAIIWALRNLMADKEMKVKQAYYQGPASIVPFLLVILVIILQLLPISVGAVIVALVISTAIVSGTWITITMAIALSLLATWSFYMLSSSLFALYIVTLPDMQPRQALRSAKNLVRFRRSIIMRRLLFLPICVLLIMAIVIVPLILLLPFTVAIAFFVLSLLAVLFIHTYLYSLYRELIA